MLDVIVTGPLMSPSPGVWDLVLDSPETSLVLVAVLFTIAMTGLALAVFAGQREARVERVPVVVRAERPRRRTGGRRR